MNVQIKNKFIVSALMFLSIATVSCGSNNSDEPEITPAQPEESTTSTTNQLRGHEFHFYYSYANNLYRSVSFSVGMNNEFNFISYAAMQMMSAKMTGFQTVSDKKLYVEIIALFEIGNIGGWSDGTPAYQEPEHIYKFDINFVDDIQGFAKVQHFYTALDPFGSLQKIKSNELWYFMRDSKVKPDRNFIDKFINNREDPDNSDQSGQTPSTPGRNEDVKLYVGKWESETEHSIGNQYYEFLSDGSFSHSHLWLPNSSGSFTCTSTSITLNIKSASDKSTVGKTKTLYLSNGKLHDKTENLYYHKIQ